MPLYQYKCSECDHSFEEMRKIAERDYDQPCPHCGAIHQFVLLVPTSPKIVTGVGTHYSKTDGWFKDRLKEIKRKHPGNTINV